jgi:hypothetical protein
MPVWRKIWPPPTGILRIENGGAAIPCGMAAKEESEKPPASSRPKSNSHRAMCGSINAWPVRPAVSVGGRVEQSKHSIVP